jgi:hypothetical protein
MTYQTPEERQLEREAKKLIRDIESRKRQHELHDMPSETAYDLAIRETLIQGKPEEYEINLRREDFKHDLWNAIRKVKRKTGEP